MVGSCPWCWSRVLPISGCLSGLMSQLGISRQFTGLILFLLQYQHFSLGHLQLKVTSWASSIFSFMGALALNKNQLICSAAVRFHLIFPISLTFFPSSVPVLNQRGGFFVTGHLFFSALLYPPSFLHSKVLIGFFLPTKATASSALLDILGL